MAKNNTTVRMRLDEVSSSREQFKPYGYKLTSENVFVDISVPSEFVIEDTTKNIVLNEDGMAYVLGTVATAIEKMHDKYYQKKFQGV